MAHAATATTAGRVADRDDIGWLEDCAARNRSTVAGLLDQAAAAYVKDQGWPEPPARV